MKFTICIGANFQRLHDNAYCIGQNGLVSLPCRFSVGFGNGYRANTFSETYEMLSRLYWITIRII